MAGPYWKMVAQNIANGLGPKALGKLGAGGKLLGRASGLVGVGFMAFELFKSYKDNIEHEPAYQEMVILQHELEMWGSAISCLGRKVFVQGRYGELNEGGAINALTEKQMVGGSSTKPADREAAATLIDRSIGYIRQTVNVFEDDAFDERTLGPYARRWPRLWKFSNRSSRPTRRAFTTAASRFKRRSVPMPPGRRYLWLPWDLSKSPRVTPRKTISAIH